MSDLLTSVVKIYLIPGTLSFLLLGMTLGLLLAIGPRLFRPFGWIALALLVVSYWALSMPLVADLLATRFRGVAATAASDPRPPCDAILVLGAGVVTYSLNGSIASVPDRQTIFNAFEGARLFKALPKPVPVVASGGVVDERWQKEPEAGVIRDLLVKAGVPAASIALDSRSRTTHEQGINLSALAKREHWQHPCVIAPTVQMPRALASFRSEGVSPIGVEAPFRSDDGAEQSVWLPSGDALDVSARALYDYLAWFYYRSRGWLD